jgi:hypothetical protein
MPKMTGKEQAGRRRRPHHRADEQATDRFKWKAAVAPVYDQWVAGAGKAGIDGKKALEDLRGQLARTGGAY